MTQESAWYIHQLADQTCQITPEARPEGVLQIWGPFDTQGEAIARRIGLIRSGKCQPLIPRHPA
ncbi:hypothetical protein [Anthocerotibacter panamensis]|uniref:hypothetical protein n=1 Tax=Anthocerotibacter panamensis TaxID=2857077 RepID=UPI001FD9590C|nr:hypothetical protein [Anthocerotibacter panamensis]